MSTEAFHWALHESRANTPTVKLALLLMADQADADCVVIVEPHTFATEARLTLDTLREVLRELLQKGLIERVVDPRVKQQTRVAYRLQGYDA